jgi:hypothetical protein
MVAAYVTCWVTHGIYVVKPLLHHLQEASNCAWTAKPSCLLLRTTVSPFQQGSAGIQQLLLNNQSAIKI